MPREEYGEKGLENSKHTQTDFRAYQKQENQKN